MKRKFFYGYWHINTFLTFLFYPVDMSTADEMIKWRIGPIRAWEIARAICKDR